MILIDLSHTSHTQARTGVQKVSRSLYTALGERREIEVCAVTWDPYRQAWRRLLPFESRTLSEESPGADRGTHWPLSWKIRGQFARWTNRTIPALPPASSLIVPEIFSANVARQLPRLSQNVSGPRVALFHDAIALKLPELTPSRTVARFPAYLRELMAFDGIAAVSEDSRNALVDWWRWLGVSQTPEVAALPLGVDAPKADPVLARTTSFPVVLCVGTLEGRKNHAALLDACETLWRQGHRFELRLVGMAHTETGREALQRVHALQQAGRPLRYDGAADEKDLSAAYHECAFTVYPSHMEGFGLPVLESLGYGKPCICSAQGALGESSRGGGCLALPSVDATSLASAIAWLLANPEQYERLSSAARNRSLKSWGTYTSDLLAWMKSLRLRSSPRG
ncbi:MAG: glycosyltransferase family 4 protein [Opitutaceae bacterium]|nr:glycosyltransferase family 4 protein [Opitutaceae bacterium]